MTPLWGKKPIRARRGQVGWGEKSRPSRGLSGFHQTRDPRPETRPLCFSRITASLPTISHHFPRFPGISRPPHPPLRRSSVHAPSAFLGQPPGTAAPARSLLSCALRSGMGRLWRGMGGMVPPEPLSAHHPHQQQGHSGFHETRDPRSKTRLLPGARRKPARIPRFSRNTKHESRLFFESRLFPRMLRR